MSFEDLFFTIREKLYKFDVSWIKNHVAFEFQVQGESEGVFYVEISEGQIKVEPYEYYDRDALFIATANTYLEICQGFLNPKLAFAIGRLKVVDTKNILDFFEKYVDKMTCI